MKFDQKRLKGIVLLVIAIVWIAVCKITALSPAAATLITLAASTVLFITELIPLGVTAASIPLILYFSGVITPKETFSGFSNENVVLFAAMFVVGGALFRSGVTEIVGNLIVRYSGGSKRRLLLYLLISVGLLSSVMSNTGCVAVLLPVCIGIADASHWDRRDVLMPLAMMASLGGTITLVGTPPNLTVNSILEAFGYETFGFFEFAYVGIPLSILGGAVLLLVYGRKRANDADSFDIESFVSQEGHQQIRLNTKQRAAIAVLLGVVAVMATNVINLSIAAAIGAMVCILAKLVTKEEALEDIDWTTIFLFAGTLPMADALDKTGAGQMIADTTIRLVGEAPSQFLLVTVVFFITCGLTQFMSNTACAALLATVGLQIAQGLGANPQSVLMIIGIAASSAFATPMATPPNTLILGHARARFSDYYKVGIPLIAVSYAVCIKVIHFVWPLF